MYRKLVFSLFLVLYTVVLVVAQDDGSNGPGGPNVSNGPDGPITSNEAGDQDAKKLKGMAVLGNNEAPMSLFIVPWKSSELGVETNLNRTLNERDVPVDRDVFTRELAFYQVSVGGK